MPLPILPGAECLLLDLLSPITLSNLSMTSKELRQQIVPLTDRLQLYTRRDISLLLKHKWPILAHLSFVAAGLGKDDIAVLAEAKDLCLPALTHLGICQQAIAAEAMHELANGRWSELAALTLSESLKQAKPSDGHSCTCKDFALAAWPQLSTLDLSGCVLTSSNFHQFTIAQYAPLQHLILSGIQLEVGSFYHLQACNLRHLTMLDLSDCFGPDRGTVKLGQSIIACNYIAACSWPHLAVLNLSSNSFGTLQKRELAKADWPALRSLDLSCNNGRFIQELASAGWTALQELNLSHLQLAESDMQQLGSAHWPQLTALNLQQVENIGNYGWGVGWGIGWGVAWMSVRLQRLIKLQVSEFMFNYVMRGWSSVTWLDVSSFALEPEQVMTLLDARGRSLDTLRVACDVSSPVTVAPEQSTWPRNTFLHLKILLQASVLQSLSPGYWPANQVEEVLDFNHAKPKGLNLVHQLVDGLKLDLGVVQLHLGNFVPAGLKHLASGPWLALQSLDLSSTCLNLDGVQRLVNAKVSFRELNLSNTNLTLQGMKQLILGHWPLLEKLALRGNHLQTSKLRQLVKGRWPFLQSVDLHQNKVQLEDVRIFLRAQWPSLVCMRVTENSFNKTDDTGDYGYFKAERREHLCKEAKKEFKVRLQVKWSNIRLVF